MKIIKSVYDMQQTRLQLHDKRIGFVPTMGYLHEGHTSLMKKATQENDLVVSSIFVNPLQFGENEDFSTYPRDEEHDITLAKENGVDILFLPDTSAMYPSKMSLIMQTVRRTDVLCGKSRPGHFDGVLTVLSKLFNIVQPQHVYFGLKDAQQVAVVDGLITDLNFPVKLIGLPTIREESGLAKSSRNVYLTEEEKVEAMYIYKALQHGQSLVRNGEHNPEKIIEETKQMIQTKTNGVIDYIEILHYPLLEPITSLQHNDLTILAIAVQFEHARLIDNLIFDSTGNIIEELR